MVKTTKILKVTTDERNGMIYLETAEPMSFNFYNSHSKALFERVVSKLMKFTGAENLEELSGKTIRVFGNSSFEKTFRVKAYGHAKEDRFIFLDIVLGNKEMTQNQMEKWNAILGPSATFNNDSPFAPITEPSGSMSKLYL